MGRLGIRGQLALLVPSLVFAAIASIAYFAVHAEYREQFEDFRARNEGVLQAISVNAAVMVAQNDVGGLDTLADQVFHGLKDRDLLELAIVDEQGRVLAHSVPERFNTVLDDDFTREAVASDGVTWVRHGRELRLGVPARSGLRWATVTARFSLDRIEAGFARTRAKWLGGALIVFSLLASLLYFSLEYLLVRPLRTLEHVVRRMGEGHLGTRVPPLRGRELGELASHVNGMATALQAERENLEATVGERTRELQDLNGRLERLAVTDGLTGVYNHRRFQEALHTELLRCERHKRPLGVLMVDVDYFKRVNDSLGHPAGDELLRRLAEVLGARSAPDRSHRPLRRRGVRGGAAGDDALGVGAGGRAHAPVGREARQRGHPVAADRHRVHRCRQLPRGRGDGGEGDRGRRPGALHGQAGRAEQGRRLAGGRVRRLALSLTVALCACPPVPDRSVPAPRPIVSHAPASSPPPGLQKLRLGLVPYLAPETMRTTHARLAEYVSRQLSVPVEVIVGDSYLDAVDRLARGEFDLVELSPYAWALASQRVALTCLTQSIADGSASASAYVFVRDDSPRHGLDDLAGARVGFVDRLSTSGYLYPMKMLKDHGLAEGSFASVEFFGNHEAVALAVLDGRVDVGSTYQGAFSALRRSRGVDPLSFRVIAKSPRTPRDVICVRPGFPADATEALRRALLALNGKDRAGREILGPLNMNGFLPFDEHAYDGVRQAAAELGPPPTP